MQYHEARQLFDLTRQSDLPQEQAYVPGGMLLCWLAEADLVSDAAVSRSQRSALRQRALTGPELFRVLGGRIDDGLLSEHGQDFACDYVGSGPGQFLADFAEQFPVPTVVHVCDTWHNYEWMRITLVARYSEWRAGLY